MNRMALALGLVTAMSGLSACKSNSETPMMGITLPDAAPVDAGMTTTEPDAGSAGTCELILAGDVPSLPAACLPRCAIATGQALNACASDPNPQMCQQNAVMADTTPAIPMMINGMAAQLNCGLCLSFQQFSCGFDVCPSETMAILQCRDQACADAAQAPFATCVQSEANRATFNACLQPLFMSCFG